MQSWTRVIAAAACAGVGLIGHAQSTKPPAPVTRAAVGAWDAAIVRRAALILGSPARWNKADTGDCDPAAPTLGVSCALDQAKQEAAGITPNVPNSSGNVGATTPADCRFHAAGAGQEGSCGTLFERASLLSITRAAAITTGVWRKDMSPSQVWAGTVVDAGYPVLHLAERLVGAVSPKHYDDPVLDYNNDPATTFADVRSFFTKLEALVTTDAAADLDGLVDDIEIEVYRGGAGVIRTPHGWFPISGVATDHGALRFTIDLRRELPPNDLDRQIIERAAALLSSDAVWNRADNRRCPAGAKTLSIYCAEQQATIELTGGFHHRRPALELVREIVEARSRDKDYAHRLMDYNNDRSTTLADVKSVFAEALAKIK